ATEEDDVTSAGDRRTERRRSALESLCAREAQAGAARALQRRQHLGGLGGVNQVDLDLFVQAGGSERQRVAEREPGLGAEALAVDGSQARAANHAPELAHEVEVTEQRARAELLEAQPPALVPFAGLRGPSVLGAMAPRPLRLLRRRRLLFRRT